MWSSNFCWQFIVCIYAIQRSRLLLAHCLKCSHLFKLQVYCLAQDSQGMWACRKLICFISRKVARYGSGFCTRQCYSSIVPLRCDLFASYTQVTWLTRLVIGANCAHFVIFSQSLRNFASWVIFVTFTLHKTATIFCDLMHLSCLLASCISSGPIIFLHPKILRWHQSIFTNRLVRHYSQFSTTVYS